MVTCFLLFWKYIVSLSYYQIKKEKPFIPDYREPALECMYLSFAGTSNQKCVWKVKENMEEQI